MDFEFIGAIGSSGTPNGLAPMHFIVAVRTQRDRIIDFICAAFFGLALLGMAIGFVGLWSSGDFQGVLMGTLAMLIGEVAIAITGIAFGLVGWGMWHLKPWARSGAIVLAALSLIAVPFGTIAGIMILVYLSRNKEAKAAFGIPPS